MPDWIAKLEKKFLKNPVKIAPLDAQSTIEQIAYQVPQEQKMAALCTLLQSAEGESSLIFGRTKFGVEKLGKQLSKLGFTVGTLHSNKSQRAREEVLTEFRHGHVQTLLATNVAARGLDITGIDQVINYELPESSELFTHRVGRTGRMGRQGKAITLLVPSEIPKWRRMARNLGQEVALQRLAIDEEALVKIPVASPEASGIREHQQNGEQRPVHGRNHFSAGQRRGRHAQSEHDSDTSSGMKRRKKDSVTSRTTARTPVWQPEGFPLPEHRSSGKVRNGRRGARKQSSFGRARGKRKAYTFTATVSQNRAARRKPRVTPAAQTRRTSSSKRSVSR